MKLKAKSGLVTLAIVVIAWWLSAPPEYVKSASAYQMGEISAGMQAAKVIEIPPSTVSGVDVPGHDDILIQEDTHQAFITARDGWFWRLDMQTGKAERFAKTPLVPSGARFVPEDHNRILFCNSQLYGFTPEKEAPVGIYELNISTRVIKPVALRVPLPPPLNPDAALGTLQPLGSGTLATSAMNDGNSRPIKFCNDLDISKDGKRIYMSEPYASPGAGMGEGAFQEAVSLANNGRLWMFDLDRQTTQLIVQDLHFVDGILIDRGSEDQHDVERSVVISETPKFRMLRLFIAGEKAGQIEVLQEGMPGMPDGISRDEKGRLYVALYSPRTKLTTWLHANPWIKPLIFRLPHSLFSEQKETGFVVLDPSGKQVLYWLSHDGSRVRAISKVLPEKDGIYLASFFKDNRGVHRIEYPQSLKD
ncbi:SMP-30/gluconolactonase/LRE family protein [Pseudomonas yamanorum]|uniref:SMP-30/gluconolactonase/LRE family protein n=1 Tax=Pseudomonas yamanorum TaxID=515393 RepID=A0A7Y8K6J7_9PSED|nr:SMP-30/gluconolactonase/LRE family protein [Pseudomonas yamanorum]NWE77816.1 SMP-30/gluconolactonase/LRE family protein [Pseudomonas yamanorum]